MSDETQTGLTGRRERVHAKDMEFGGEHPVFDDPMKTLTDETHVLVVGHSDADSLKSRILRSREMYGRVAVLVSEDAPPRVLDPHDREVRLALVDDPEAPPTPDPTEPYQPMNRHARRKAAAMARKGGGR